MIFEVFFLRSLLHVGLVGLVTTLHTFPFHFEHLAKRVELPLQTVFGGEHGSEYATGHDAISRTLSHLAILVGIGSEERGTKRCASIGISRVLQRIVGVFSTKFAE